MSGEILAASAGAVGRILAVSCVGVFCGRYPRESPLLSPEIRRGISKLLLEIMVPALATHSIATSVTREGLAEMWPLFVWCFLSVTLGAVCSYGVSRVLKLEGSYQKAFIAAGTFGNNVGLPLLILSTLCSQPILKDKYPTCKRTSFGLVMLYGIPWRLAMFGIAIPLLKKTSSHPADAATTAEEIDDAIEMMADVNEPCEDDEQQEQQPYVEDGGGNEEEETFIEKVKTFFNKKVPKIRFDINIMGPLIGVAVGSIPEVQKFLVGSHDEPAQLPVLGDWLESLGEPVVTLSTMVLASALVPKAGTAKEFCKPSVIKQVIGLCTIRFIIVPVTGYALVYTMRDIMPGSPLQWLVILIEFSVPSAQIVIVSMAAMGKHTLASSMAPVYAVQYVTCVFALTAWTAAALYIIKEFEDTATPIEPGSGIV